MGRITKLERQKGAVARISVFVDDLFLAGLSAKAIRDLDLTLGMEIFSEFRSRIIQEAARESALLSLARREHCRAELAAKLRQKRFPDATVKTVLDRLEALGQLDDRRFARAWVERRKAYHPRGRQMLVLELKQKGVSQDVINDVLDEMLGPTDEEKLLIELIRKRVQSSDRSDPDRFKNRLLGFLARRGFTYDDIRRILNMYYPEI
jgi:regulatory protein